MRIKFLSMWITIAVLFAVDARVFAQATPDEFLKVLTEAGLVTGNRQGRNIWYAAVPSALEALRLVLGTPVA